MCDFVTGGKGRTAGCSGEDPAPRSASETGIVLSDILSGLSQGYPRYQARNFSSQIQTIFKIFRILSRVSSKA